MSRPEALNNFECKICEDEGWVCENHRTEPWRGGEQECCGGAGAPCICHPLHMSKAHLVSGCSINQLEDEFHARKQEWRDRELAKRGP